MVRLAIGSPQTWPVSMWFYRTITLRISRQIPEDWTAQKHDPKLWMPSAWAQISTMFGPFPSVLEKVCMTAFLELILPVYNKDVMLFRNKIGSIHVRKGLKWSELASRYTAVILPTTCRGTQTWVVPFSMACALLTSACQFSETSRLHAARWFPSCSITVLQKVRYGIIANAQLGSHTSCGHEPNCLIPRLVQVFTRKGETFQIAGSARYLFRDALLDGGGCQKLVDGITESSRASQVHSLLNFPNEFLAYDVQSTMKDGVALGRCHEPILKLFHPGKLILLTVWFRQTTSRFIGKNHTWLQAPANHKNMHQRDHHSGKNATNWLLTIIAQNAQTVGLRKWEKHPSLLHALVKKFKPTTRC